MHSDIIIIQSEFFNQAILKSESLTSWRHVSTIFDTDISLFSLFSNAGCKKLKTSTLKWRNIRILYSDFHIDNNT